MLRSFHQGLLEYANSRWGRRIFVWSSIAIVIGAIVFATSMGIDSGANLLGGGIGSGVAGVLHGARS